MKRALSLLLTFLMVAAIVAVPVLAYDASALDLWPSEWHASLNLAFKDTTAAPLSSLGYSQEIPNSAETQADPINSDIISQSKDGVLTLTNTGKISAATGFIYNVLTAGQPDTVSHNLLTSAGSTIDFGVRFDSLPKATNKILTIDENGAYVAKPTTSAVPSTALNKIGSHLGFVVNVHSLSPFIQEDGTTVKEGYSTEYYLAFVAYDNEVLGTNGAIIFISGNATSWSSRTGAMIRNVYFCDLDFGAEAAFHRYTLTTDYAKGVAGEDMVTLYIDGEKETTFSAPAFRKLNDTLGDYVKLGLHLNGYCELGEEDAIGMQVSLDQFSVYGTALTPKDGTLSTFKEEAPLYTEDFAAALEAAANVDKTKYSKKTVKVLEDAIALTKDFPAVEEMTKETVTQQQLDEATQAINEAIENLRLNDPKAAIEEKRLYIPFSYFNADDPTGYAHAWTNSTIIFTDPNYDIGNYKVNGSAVLDDFLSIVFEKGENENEYKVANVYPRGTKMENRVNKAPEGGFIIYSHNNIPYTSSSRYASQLFGDANAVVATQIEVGQIAILENVTIHSDKAATLVTDGIWRSRYDPEKVSTANDPICNEIIAKYPYNGTSDIIWQDQFDDFSTISALVMQLPIGAFMDEYNEISGKVQAAIETQYTADSWKALQDVVATIDLSDKNLTQDMIDEWTAALTEAYEALVKIENPDGGNGGSNNPGSSEDTGDTDFVLVALAVIGLASIACVAVLVIGRRRGNF